MKKFLAITPLLALTGCLIVSNSTIKTSKDGIREVTHTRAIAWGDTRTTTASVHNGIGTNFSGTASTGIDSTTSGTNGVAALNAIGTILQALPK